MTSRGLHGCTLTLSLALAAACGGAGPRTVVDSRAVKSSSRAPTISAVTDLGDVRAVPLSAPVPVSGSDGVGSVGEWVLIEGDNFGRQPTLSIGGRPAEVLARTGNGGIVSRIPTEVAGGAAAVEVTNRGGRGAGSVAVTRYAAVGGDSIQLIVLAGSPVLGPSVAAPAVSAVAFHRRGHTLYALTAGKLLPVSLTGAPRSGKPVEAGAATLLAGAASADTLAAVGGGRVLIYDTRDAMRPRFRGNVSVAGSAVAAAMTADGSKLVVLIAEGNRLVIVDTRDVRDPRALPALALLPDEKLSLVRGLAMLPGDNELVVVAGDNKKTLVAGDHPTRLLEVSIAGAPSVLHVATVGTAGAPVAIAAGRYPAIGSATSVRSNRKRAVIALASVERASLKSPSAAAVSRLSMVDLDGNARTLAEGDMQFGPLSIPTDNLSVIAITRRTGSKNGLAASIYRVDGAASPSSVSIAAGAASPSASAIAVVP